MRNARTVVLVMMCLALGALSAHASINDAQYNSSNLQADLGTSSHTYTSQGYNLSVFDANNVAPNAVNGSSPTGTDLFVLGLTADPIVGHGILDTAGPGRDNKTPEPGTLALFGSGVLGIAGVLRRKMKA